jgi:hypothetical protein
VRHGVLVDAIVCLLQTSHLQISKPRFYSITTIAVFFHFSVRLLGGRRNTRRILLLYPKTYQRASAPVYVQPTYQTVSAPVYVQPTYQRVSAPVYVQPRQVQPAVPRKVTKEVPKMFYDQRTIMYMKTGIEEYTVTEVLKSPLCSEI